MQAKNEKKDGRINNRSERLAFAAVDGLEQFAARWHYPLQVVKLAKKAGCVGFLSGNRVDPVLAIPALNDFVSGLDELPEGCKTWKEVGEKFRGLILKLDHEEKQKTLMPCSSAIKQAGEAGGYMFAELERMARELPPGLAGSDAVTIGKRLSAEVDKIRVTLNEKVKLIGE